MEILNPDDITAKMFSEAILTSSDKDGISNQTLSKQQRNILLLKSLESSIKIDYNSFSTFLNILDEFSKYNALVVRIRDKLVHQ